MNKPVAPHLLAGTETAHERWQREFKEGVADDREIANVSGIPVQPLYTAADRAALGRRRAARLSRPARLHARHLRDHAPRPHLDAAPARRPRHAGRLQPAPARPPRSRRDRGLADPVQLGLPRLRHGLGRARAARHLRRRRQQRRPHGPLPRRRRRRRDLVRDERPVAVHAARLHAGRRRAARHRLEEDHRHVEPERLPLALRRQPHVLPALAAGRAPRADRPHRLVPPVRAALEPDVGGRPAHAAGGRDAGRGDGVHALERGAERRGLHRPRHGPRRVPAALHLLLRHLALVLRGDRQVPRRPAHLGAHRARAPRREGREGVALQVPRPDLGRRPDAPAAAQQHRARHRAGDGRDLRRPAVAPHRRLRRGATRRRARPARASPSPPRTSCARKRTSPT